MTSQFFQRYYNSINRLLIRIRHAVRLVYYTWYLVIDTGMYVSSACIMFQLLLYFVGSIAVLCTDAGVRAVDRICQSIKSAETASAAAAAEEWKRR